MIALVHTKGVSAGFLAFVLVATAILVAMAWYAIRHK